MFNAFFRTSNFSVTLPLRLVKSSVYSTLTKNGFSSKSFSVQNAQQEMREISSALVISKSISPFSVWKTNHLWLEHFSVVNSSLKPEFMIKHFFTKFSVHKVDYLRCQNNYFVNGTSVKLDWLIKRLIYATNKLLYSSYKY